MAKRGAIERTLTHLGVPFEKLTRDETAALQGQWRRAFAQSVKRRTGEWVHHGCDWHAFSYGLVFAESGDAAFNLYRSEAGPQLLVLPEGSCGSFPTPAGSLAFRAQSTATLYAPVSRCGT